MDIWTNQIEYEKLDMNIEKILNNIKKKKIESLPSYVPRDGIINRGMRNIGVLDGTSHFIELFRVNKILKKRNIAMFMQTYS